MIIKGSYIQYAGGYQKEYISIEDVQKAISDLSHMDEEHGAFWVGVYGDEAESILETHKDLKLICNLGGENLSVFDTQLNDISEAESFYLLQLNGEIENLINKITKHKRT